MLSLANDCLDVSVLDPLQDQARLGSRYVTGGYVYQIYDRKLGPILSGPGYPSEEQPPVFDGQGLPEAFFSPLGADPAAAPDGTVLMVIGVGLIKTPAGPLRDFPVLEFCKWGITQAPGKVIMETRQAFQGWALDLKRELILENRTLSSLTHIANTGQKEIPIRWFPHPFYPWYPSGECCKFNFPVRFPDNPGYTLRDSGFVQMKLDPPWDRRGHFQMLEFTRPEKLLVLQKHPKLGLVAATCSFAPAFMPIWGNCNTFSFEPFYELTLGLGQEAQWSITYDF